MSKKGENIRRRADGRWEGRYKCVSAISPKANYKSVYGKSYIEVQQRLNAIRQEEQWCSTNPAAIQTFSDCAALWLYNILQRCKYSTYVKYRYIYSCHLEHFARGISIHQISLTMCEEHLITEHRRHDPPFSLSTMKSICHVLNQILKYGRSDIHVALPYQITLSDKYVPKNIEVFSTYEQRKLLNYLYNDIDQYKLGRC